jgi:uncharacterized protein (TIGR03435 family)
MAYNLKVYQMAGQIVSPGPRNDQFDVVANVPEGTTTEQFSAMQLSLLKERFKLALHFDKKEMEGYELVVARGGIKMKEAAPHKADPDRDRGHEITGPPPVDRDGYPSLPATAGPYLAMMNGRTRWVAKNQSAREIAERLEIQLRRPVIDATGLNGRYDFDLKWATVTRMRPPAITASEPAGPGIELDAGPTLAVALQEQLGLRLQAKKVPIDVPVIDHVEKAPTEN